MNPQRAVRQRLRIGMSLLELTIAMAATATLMASVIVLIRSGYATWNEYENDLEVTENGYAALRHIVRQLRQADAITAISAAVDTSGNLSVSMPDSSTYTWDHNSSQDSIFFNPGSGNQLLATQINELSFVAYEADGTTATTIVDDIQLVECRVKITLPHGAGVPMTLSCRTWIRSW